MNHLAKPVKIGPPGNQVRVGGKHTDKETTAPLILSMFHPHDKTLINPEEGEFDEDMAMRRVSVARELSERYNVPLMVALAPEYVMTPYLEWLAEVWPGVIVLDGYFKAKSEGLQYARETGLIERVVYNSVSRSTTDQEWRLLRENQPPSVVMQLSGYDAASRYKSIHHPIDGKPLIDHVHELGIENVLIDLATTGLASMADIIETYFMIKKTLPYPAGSVPANIREFERVAGTLGVEEMNRDTVLTASNALAYFFGDFTYAGPIAWAKLFFETAALMEEVKGSIQFDFGDF